MPFEEPDQEMAEFFGTVKPPPTSLAPGAMADSTKRRRETDQGHGRWADWEPAQWNPRGRYQGHRTSGRDPLVLSLARLALRHEEEIRLLQQDTTLVLWFSPGQDSVLPHLYQTAVAFKKRQQSEPTWGLAHVPLKQVMATHSDVPRTQGTAPKGASKPGLAQKGRGHGMAGRQGMVLPSLEPPTSAPRTGPFTTPGDGCGHDQ